jgi:hypothetical protein
MPPDQSHAKGEQEAYKRFIRWTGSSGGHGRQEQSPSVSGQSASRSALREWVAKKIAWCRHHLPVDQRRIINGRSTSAVPTAMVSQTLLMK